MQKRLFPIILTIALLCSSLISFYSIHNLQGNAKVINYTGVVRGASQRLIKQELNHTPNDALIERLDGIITELQTGKGEHGLIRLNSEPFQELIAQMQTDWMQIKLEIYAVRAGGPSNTLFKDSESFFELSDKAVTAAEQYSEKSVGSAERGLISLNVAFVLLIIILSLYNAKQARLEKKLLEEEEENKKKKEKLTRLAEDIRAPMNDISELLYVTDVDTYELLFLNKAGFETFHVDSLDGRKCYEVLQGKDAPCEYCTNCYLKEGENYTWEHTNPITNRHYILKDRLVEWDGRMARMEIAFDTTDAEREKIQLKFTLDAEKMVTDCVSILYEEGDLNKAIQKMLEQLGSFLSADRAYVFFIRDHLMYNDYEWCSDGIISQKNQLQGLPMESIDRWMPYFKRRECMIIKDLDEIKESCPEEYGILHEQGITSLVAAPLERDGAFVGYLGVDNPPPDKLLNIAPLLHTLCYFLLLACRHAESQQQLSQLSYYDTLTSFYNRNRFIIDTDALARSEGPVGIIYLDVNGLKDINDLHGHEVGDRVLAECAKQMKDVFQEADFYRIGGDEFVIICPGMEEELFKKKTRQLRAKFQDDNEYQAAIGTHWSQTIDDLSQIIADADAKMYEDKKDFYHRHPVSHRYRHHSDEVLHLSNPDVLQEEIDKNRFVVYLQPKISSANRCAVGAEALIRYRSKSDTLILPGNFLPLLEEIESIGLIDFYVFQYVCKKLKDWMEQGKEAFPISVNFSSATLAQPSFIEKLTAICNSYNIAPKYIEIEVTERLQNTQGLDIKSLICKLRKAGFVVAIDDFGTESANLSLLSEAQFDILKLDKSMIDNIAVNPKTKAVVESISEICRKLGIQMIAEGIETEEQFSALQTCGVDLAQGFLFSKPISAEEYEERFLST